MAANTPDYQALEALQYQERGNAFFQERQFREASVCYSQAIHLAPENPDPLMKLAAVEFESGNFDRAALLRAKALSLSNDSTQAWKDAALSGLAKSHLYNDEPTAGLSVAQQLTDGDDKEKLMADLSLMLQLKEGQRTVGFGSERGKVITRLPRYRSSL